MNSEIKTNLAKEAEILRETANRKLQQAMDANIRADRAEQSLKDLQERYLTTLQIMGTVFLNPPKITSKQKNRI